MTDQYENKYNLLDRRIHLENPIPINIEYIGFIIYKPGEHGLSHRYPHWVFSFADGCDAKFGVAGGELLLPSNDMLIMPPYVQHEVRYVVGPSNMRLVYFGINVDMPYEDISISEINMRARELPEYKLFVKVLREITLHFEVSLTVKNISMHASEILEHSIRFCRALKALYCKDVNEGCRAKRYLQIEEAKRILLRNLGGNISIHDVAREMYFSPRYLSDLFVKATGMSFVAYYKMLRMEHAYTLMCSTELSVSEIADQMGYCNIQYFSSQFKEYFGCSPSMVRKQSGKCLLRQ